MARTPTTTTAADSGEWLTSDQVMDRLLEDPVLRRMASTCVLPAVRCGDEWRFRRSDLDQWIGRQKRTVAEMNGTN
jgi:excisionase family DNA binding protein